MPPRAQGADVDGPSLSRQHSIGGSFSPPTLPIPSPPAQLQLPSIGELLPELERGPRFPPIAPLDAQATFDASSSSQANNRPPSPTRKNLDTPPSPFAPRNLYPESPRVASLAGFGGHDSSASSSGSSSGRRRGSLHEGTACFYCNTTKTPLWRRCPTSGEPICNACGLQLKARGVQRQKAEAVAAASALIGAAGPGDAALQLQAGLMVPTRGPPKARRKKSDAPAPSASSGSPASIVEPELEREGLQTSSSSSLGFSSMTIPANTVAPKVSVTAQRKKSNADSIGASSEGGSGGLSGGNKASHVCANCGATVTPLWRRDEDGSTIW